MTDGAYAAAVKLLQDRFEKPRIIHRLCCEDIKALTPNNNSRVSITEMADKVQHILTGLTRLGSLGASEILTSMTELVMNKELKGALAYGDYFFPKKFEFVSLCSFICLQVVYQLSGPVCKATWSGCPSYSASYLHFTLCD